MEIGLVTKVGLGLRKRNGLRSMMGIGRVLRLRIDLEMEKGHKIKS
jgi:hypothetical protein